MRLAAPGLEEYWLSRCGRHERSNETVRLVLAIISFVIAAALIGLGIAQKPLAGPDHITAAVATTSSAPVSVIDGSALNAFERSQTISASGSDSVVAAYGRTDDVLAWVGSASYNKVTYNAKTGELKSKLVTGSESSVPDPTGSDLWLADYKQQGAVDFTVNVPDSISVLVVSDGSQPAPPNLSVTWMRDNSTPLALPLVLGGAVMLLLGLILLLLALHQVRRSRGPRRKPQRLPKVPKPPAYRAQKGRGQLAPKRGRRSASVAAVILVGAVAISGCSNDGLGPIVSTSSDAALADTTEAKPPVVTLAQARRIVARISETSTAADEARDADAITTRFAGAALDLRLANYKIRKSDKKAALPVAIEPGPVGLVLPQQQDEWPRTFMAVINDENDDTVAPVALILIQDDARSQYKVHYAVQLAPGTVIKNVASATVGTARVDPSLGLFTVTPAEMWMQYGDILINDTDSVYYNNFQASGDMLREAVGKADKEKRRKKLPRTAKLIFTNEAGPGEVVVLATNDAGAIVALDLHELETVRPVEAGAAVTAQKDVAALLGKTLSTKSLRATYGDQLLFYVPSAKDGGPAVLLGYAQGLLDAKEVKK
jgi:hypothetical protein